MNVTISQFQTYIYINMCVHFMCSREFITCEACANASEWGQCTITVTEPTQMISTLYRNRNTHFHMKTNYFHPRIRVSSAQFAFRKSSAFLFHTQTFYLQRKHICFGCKQTSMGATWVCAFSFYHFIQLAAVLAHACRINNKHDLVHCLIKFALTSYSLLLAMNACHRHILHEHFFCTCTISIERFWNYFNIDAFD